MDFSAVLDDDDDDNDDEDGVSPPVLSLIHDVDCFLAIFDRGMGFLFRILLLVGLWTLSGIICRWRRLLSSSSHNPLKNKPDFGCCTTVFLRVPVFVAHPLPELPSSHQLVVVLLLLLQLSRSVKIRGGSFGENVFLEMLDSISMFSEESFFAVSLTDPSEPMSDATVSVSSNTWI